jgi:hypothetical protein
MLCEDTYNGAIAFTQPRVWWLGVAGVGGNGGAHSIFSLEVLGPVPFSSSKCPCLVGVAIRAIHIDAQAYHARGTHGSDSRGNANTRNSMFRRYTLSRS